MPKWTKPSDSEQAAPIDVLILGAVGSADWRGEFFAKLDELGLVYHDPGGLLVATDGLPDIGVVVVGLGDPGSGNHGLESWLAIGRYVGGRYGGPNELAVFKFGELEGDAWTEHDREIFASLEAALPRSRVHVAEDLGELARVCATRRVFRWDADAEVETTNTTTVKRKKRRAKPRG